MVSAELLEERRIVGHEAVAAEGHEAAHETHVVHGPENDGEAEPARKADAAGRGQADVRVEGEQPAAPVNDETTSRSLKPVRATARATAPAIASAPCPAGRRAAPADVRPEADGSLISMFRPARPRA